MAWTPDQTAQFEWMWLAGEKAIVIGFLLDKKLDTMKKKRRRMGLPPRSQQQRAA